MGGVLEALAALSQYIPVVEKPARRPSLPFRILITAIVLILYFVMTVIPLYGVKPNPGALGGAFVLAQIILGMSFGTLATLGIGPIVTAGLVLEVLIGTGLIELDLTNPRDRAVYMGAQKTLSLIFAALEAAAYSFGCAFWGGSPFACPAPLWLRLLVILQLVLATLIIIWFDELLQRGWGLGSALSLFILAGVSKSIVNRMLSPARLGGEVLGVIPYILETGNVLGAIVRPYPLADLVGLVATFVLIVVLVYLQLMRVEIPVTGPRLRGIRTRIPLNFIYVTNIPILLVAIIVADLGIVANALSHIGGPVYEFFALLYHYINTPKGLLMVVSHPVEAVTSAIAWVVLSIFFGKLWVELAGLSPDKQAENLIKSGFEVPGLRRNKKILESLLARYIYPLTLLSSIIVGILAVVADFFGAYGTGSGLLLATGIAINYYQLLIYERTLEMYPMLKRLLGG